MFSGGLQLIENHLFVGRWHRLAPIGTPPRPARQGRGSTGGGRSRGLDPWPPAPTPYSISAQEALAK